MKIHPGFFSGTSNLVSPIKTSEYPPEFSGASRLSYYASMFSSVEINATFYKLPKCATVEKWRDSVPYDFRFTFKVSKGVTHAKDLLFSSAELEQFVETVNHIGEKKGCLLVQLPPKVSSDQEEQLAALLECLYDNAKGWKTAVEFRHPSWYDRNIYRMLQHYKATMAEQDIPKSATPKVQVAESFVYLRFHGPEPRYSGSYDNSTLENVAKRIVSWLKEKKEVYVYFNNTMGDAFGNLQTLNRMVGNLLH